MAVSTIQGNVDSGWKTLPLRSGININVFLYRVKNGICYCMCANVGGWTSPGDNVWTAFADLPVGARPSANIYGSFSARNGHVGEWRILPSGSIEVNAKTSSSEFSFNAVFLVS